MNRKGGDGMWKCPVCDRENEHLLCESCGFDGSCDYESYPTLQRLMGTAESVSGRKTKRKPVLVCPKCGGTHILTRQKDQTHICLLCNHSFSEDPQKQLGTDGITDGEIASEASGKARYYPGLEKVVFWLGWLYILLHLYHWWFGNPARMGLMQFLLHHGLILIALIMQLRLRRKGFAGLKPNVLFLFLLAPFLYLPVIAIIAFVLLVGMAMVVIAMLVGLLSFRSAFASLTLGVIYHLLWNVGVAGAAGKGSKKS